MPPNTVFEGRCPMPHTQLWEQVLPFSSDSVAKAKGQAGPSFRRCEPKGVFLQRFFSICEKWSDIHNKVVTRIKGAK